MADVSDVARSDGWTVLDEVTVLWAEHRGRTFPDDLLPPVGGDRICVPYPDGEMAGCIMSYVANRGVLDPVCRRILRSCARDLKPLLPRLRGDGAAHVARLVRMADLIELA